MKTRMTQRDSLNTASNFWANISISSFFKSIVCCGCGERDTKNAKAPLGLTPTRSINDETTRDQDELDRSWQTEQYIEYHPEGEVYEITKPLVTRPKERLLGSGMELRKSTRLTGKGVSYKETGDNGDTDDDDSKLASTKIARKKIKKQKDSDDVQDKGTSKGSTRGRNLWQPHEDEMLKKLITKHGKHWSTISKLMGGTRTGKQIRDRYLCKLDPTINEREWTQQEDQLLVQYWRQFGNKWAEIAKHLEGRTESMVKNRYYSFISKRMGPDGVINYDMEEVQGSNSQNSNGSKRARTQKELSEMSQTMSEQRQPAVNVYELSQSISYQQSQPFTNGFPQLQHSNTTLSGYGASATVQSDEIFLKRGLSSQSSYSNPNKVPLLPHAGSFDQAGNEVVYYSKKNSDSFMSLEKSRSNNYDLRLELQRSLGNSGNENQMIDLFGFRNTYNGPQIIEEVEDAKSDVLPSSDPYGYSNRYRRSNTGGEHLRAWKQQALASEEQGGLFGNGGLWPFDQMNNGQMNEIPEFMTSNKMELENHVDKLVSLCHSRAASFQSKKSGSFNENNYGGDFATDQDAVIPNRSSLLLKRQDTLRMLLQMNENELRMEGSFALTPTVSFSQEKSLFPTTSQ